MMTGTHRDMMLIEDLSDIVRMHALQVEGQNTESPLTGIEQFEPRDPRQPVDAVAGQSLLMFENVVTSELLDEVDRRTKADRAGDVRRPRFEPVRRLLVLGLLEGDVEDHLAAALPGRHCRQQLIAAIERTDPGRPVNLVAGQRVKVAAERLYIDRQPRSDRKSVV